MPTEKAGCDEEQRGIRRGFTMVLFNLSQALDGLKASMAEIEAELARLAAKQKSRGKPPLGLMPSLSRPRHRCKDLTDEQLEEPGSILLERASKEH